MKAVNELIRLGFNLSVKDGNIKLESSKSNPPDLVKAKPLIQELKRDKEEAVKYLESLIVYEIYDGLSFDFQVQACLEASLEKNIQWLRTDVYRESRKVVLIGVFLKPELSKDWKAACREVSHDSHWHRECPWVNERMVQ